MVTRTEYSALDKAYEFLNGKLFGNNLSPLLITLHRRPKSKGYFLAQSFKARVGKASVHELALNPEVFVGRSDEEILSTLVHEMVHAWQQEHGRPPRRCYHDREWADKMKEVGLYPSTTGEPGGKEVGQRVTHYIIQGGSFQRVCADLLKSGWELGWESPAGRSKASSKSSASKTKFTCPSCGQNAWAKPTALLICGQCAVDNRLEVMAAA